MNPRIPKRSADLRRAMTDPGFRAAIEKAAHKKPKPVRSEKPLFAKYPGVNFLFKGFEKNGLPKKSFRKK